MGDELGVAMDSEIKKERIAFTREEFNKILKMSYCVANVVSAESARRRAATLGGDIKASEKRLYDTLTKLANTDYYIPCGEVVKW